MDLLKELENYEPYDELEKTTIESLKQFLNAFGDFAYSRDCLPGHLTTVVWIVNPKRTKVLMGYHNLFKTFTWFGGHADGEKDLLKNAMIEFEEETGIPNFKVLNNRTPIDYIVLKVLSHIKKGRTLADHLHYAPAYVFEVSEEEVFRIAQDENSAIKWVNNEDVLATVTEDEVLPIYKRIMEKTKKLK
ncbi:MAG: NUDIX domain-containing protein [Lactobacillaceae bacterium]|jgi:8-oxo-dGTP pyrophosphatase MutT (NUDIX family)|nr:NUDIX domain-containing protein [Lactobacillaceae bacterium]